MIWKFYNILLKYENPETAAELMSFHKVIDAVVEEQERLFEAHKASVELEKKTIWEEERLLQQMDKNDMDIDKYANTLEALLVEKLKAISEVKKHLEKVKKSLGDEEILHSTRKFQVLYF